MGTNETAPAHSALGASGAHRWMTCPASVRVEASYPDSGSQAAAEGTDAHDLARVCLLNGEADASSYEGLPVLEVLSKPGASGRETVPAEWVESVNVYLAHVWDRSTAEVERYVEERLSLDTIRSGMFGTADCVLLNPDKGTLEVVDFKHGAGHVVEVEGNPQLQYYALAALLRFHNHPIETVTVSIVQPRAPHSDGPVRSVTFHAGELLEFFGTLSAAVAATEDPAAPFVPGPHCKFCKHAPDCKALAAAATAEFSTVPAEGGAPNLSDAELARRFLALELVETYAKAIREETELRAQKGKVPPGLKWVAGRGSRLWAKPGLEVAAEIEAAACIDVTERICPSPAQVEKLLGKRAFGSIAGHLVEKKAGRPKLVAESDKRPAITPTADDWKTSEFAPIAAE